MILSFFSFRLDQEDLALAITAEVVAVVHGKNLADRQRLSRLCQNLGFRFASRDFSSTCTWFARLAASVAQSTERTGPTLIVDDEPRHRLFVMWRGEAMIFPLTWGKPEFHEILYEI